MFSFTVISSNIRFDNPTDGAHSWQGRRHILADALNSYRPDVIGTQEGWEPQLRDFNELLDDLEIVDSNRQWISDRMYPSIFYRPERFELINSGDIWLSQTPYVAASKSFGSAFPRLCTWAILKAKENGKNYFFVNAHLDHLETQTRQEQIKVLINEIAKFRGDYPMVLTGDFNESPFEGVRKEIDKSNLKLTDPWFTLGHEECESHHSFKGQREDGSRIDWILHSTETFDCVDIHLHKEKSSEVYPSDHFPVVATLSAK